MATAAAEAGLVKCPKCSKLLREVPDFPMYRCGGCGAILRAKNSGLGKQSVSLAPETSSSSAIASDIKERVSENAELLATSKSNENGSSEAKTEYSFNQEEEEKKSLKIKDQDSDRSMQSDKLRSSTASSSDDGSSSRKYRQMSRRTIRDQRFSGSDSTKSKGGGEDLSRNSSVDSDAPRRRGGALNSESFFSVQSWVESKEEGPSRSLSRHSASSEHPSKFKKLVEELRELSEKKPRSWPQHQMPVSNLHCHLEPNLCCNNRLCAACSYSFCCHSSKSRRSAQRRKARAAKSYCRPVSGGAPFFICSKCFEVLHMPADFVVSTGCSNKLRCGACSEIMLLSFPARQHEMSRTNSDEAGKPPEDPISFSDEYGVDSFADGSSTEAEPAVNVSRAPSRAAGDGSRPSLHRLMGYTSARRLLF